MRVRPGWEMERSKIKSLDKRNIEDILPLTPLQAGLLFHYLKASDKDHYFEQLSLGICGTIDSKVFEQAWNFVIQDNEILRTLFRWEDIGEPVQIVLKEFDFKPRYYDFSGENSSRRKELQAQIRIKDKAEKFDLREVPFRVTLCKFADDRYEMIISSHHILYDGWSNGIILHEFFTVYGQMFHGGSPVKIVKTEFKDFLNWLRLQDPQKQEKYWREYLQGWGGQTELPLKDTKRESKEITAPGVFQAKFPGGLKDKLETFPKVCKITLACLLYGTWGLLLQKYGNSRDVIFGTTVSGRTAGVKGIEDMVGLFINTIPLRLKAPPRQRIQDLLSRLHSNLRDREEYEHTPLVDIKQYAGLDPNEELFDSVVVIENYPLDRLSRDLAGKKGGLKVDNYGIFELAHYDLTVGFMLGTADIEMNFIYDADLFPKKTVARLYRHFTCVLEKILHETDREVREIDILLEEERSQILYEFNDTRSSYPNDKTISQLFQKQVEKIPDRIAVVGPEPGAGLARVRFRGEGYSPFYQVSLTYRELGRESDHLARLLRDKGVRYDTIVGLMVERSLEMVIGLLGILKSGGAYLPLDPDYPSERIIYLLVDCQASLLLTTCQIFSEVWTTASWQGETIFVEEIGLRQEAQHAVPLQTDEPLSSQTAGDVCLRSNAQGPLEDKAWHLVSAHRRPAAALAYIIFTSGTTGKPKGVMVSQRNVIRLVKNTNYIDFKPDDRVLQTGALEFDASSFEIWGTLLNGLTLYLASKEVLLDPQMLRGIIASHHITTMWLTAPLYNQMVQDNVDIFAGLRNLLVGGDVLSPPHINRVRRRFPRLRIINGYGPTENTTFSTTFSIEKEYQQGIPIGKPIANSNAYIMDKDDHLQPVGIAGELYVGGDGVARGYLNDPALTADKFILSPASVPQGQPTLSGDQYQMSIEHNIPSHQHSIIPGAQRSAARIYCTGDLARWLPDGSIDFLGRIDQQVKVRGFRIEPGEIETQLLNHEAVKEAVVLARGDAGGEKYLCAYIVAKTQNGVGTGTFCPPAKGESRYSPDPGTPELQKFLSRSLPDYMIPAHFIHLDRIPLTPNGKVDRKALPKPEFTIGEDYVPATDEVEVKLVKIWSEILNRGASPLEYPQIGINDNFFRLGGHSLKATRLISKIHKVFEVRVPLEELFKTPTIAGLSRWIKRAAGDKYTSIEPIEKKEYYKLSSAQKRLFILQYLEPDLISYNISAAVVLKGVLDSSRLEETFQELISRHESLRTSFLMIDGEPVQRLHHQVEFKVDSYNTGIRQQASEKINNFIRPFDLSLAPLLRVGLIKLHEDKHILMVDMHHIVSDGTSMRMFVKDFMAIYGGDGLKPLRIHYKDYAEWQNKEKQGDVVSKQGSYWLDQLAVPGEIPVLNLAADYPRAAFQSFAGSSINFDLGREETEALKALALKEEVTLYIVLLSIYYAWLYRLSSQEDIIVGTPIAARRHADLQEIIGMFVNTLALRHRPVGEKTFADFLQEVKQQTLAAFENQDYPFEDLVENAGVNRDASRNPLFDVMFALQNLEIPKMKIPGLNLEPYDLANRIAKFDLFLQGFEGDRGLQFNLEYSTSLFKIETAQRLVRSFKEVISSVLENPDKRLFEIEIVPADEKRRLLHEFNETAAEYPKDKTIPQVFAEQVQRTPERIAVIGMEHDARQPQGIGESVYSPFNQVSLTYRELDGTTAQLTYLLNAKNVQPNTIVAVKLERSLEMIIGILAILKAGGAYLPIEPDCPESRVGYMLADSAAQILLTVRDLSAGPRKIGSWQGETIFLDQSADCKAVVAKPTAQEVWQRAPYALNKPPASAASLAYVLYTSGSTGKPKGVLVEHDSVINVLYALDRYYPFDESCVYLLKTSYTFDVSVTELFGWFFGAGAAALLEKFGENDPKKIINTIQMLGITHINFVPSMFRAFLDSLTRENIARIPLKYVFLAGEALPGELVNQFREFDSGVQLENIYGPTEATIYASKYSLSAWQGGRVPIGRPLANVRLYILNSHGGMQGIGVPGQLSIAGVGVARGYLNQSELSAEKFISGRGGTRLYCTGDLACWLPNGDIQFLGRIDHQVKIRGIRIELGEIESKLLTHHEIDAAVVVLREDQKKNQHYLCAYFSSPHQLSIPELRQYLSRSLPDYMIPSYFVHLDKLSLSPSGKVDRGSLPMPQAFQRHLNEPYAAPETDIERIVASAWQEVLKLEKIGIDDNFFDSGGNSLNMLQVNFKLNQVFANRLPVIVMFRYTTIRSLCRFLDSLLSLEVQDMGTPLDRKKRADVLERGKSDRQQRYQKRKMIDAKIN